MKSKIILLLMFLFTIAFGGPAFSATYTYDNANRLLKIDHGNGTEINYTYDANGNMVSMSVDDTLPPNGSISINNGAASTASTSATLTLSASDNSGTVSEMRFSNDNAAWSAWEPYGASKAWTLSEGNGTKTVYAEFKDQQGNVSETYSDSIESNVNGIDLVINTLTISPTTVPAGTNIAIGYTVQNLGTSVSAGTGVHFYRTTDPVNGTGSVYLGSGSVPSLSGGTSHSGTFNNTVAVGTTPGTYYIRAVVDVYEEVEETDETNNLQVTPAFNVTQDVDLNLSGISVSPTTVPVGTNIAIGYTVQNLGTSVSAGTGVHFYRTTDPVNGTGSVYLGSGSVPSLSGGTSHSGTFNNTVAVGTTPGTYYIRAVVDVYEEVEETDETNNLQVTPAFNVTQDVDLNLSGISVSPTTVPVGTNIAIGYTVQNLGTSVSAGTGVHFYRTTDPVNGTGSVYLGSGSVPSLSGGTSHSGTFNNTVAVGTTPGTYYIRAVVDVYEEVEETDETNNAIVSEAISVTAIDLHLLEAIAPASRTAGQVISVIYTIQNIGSSNSSSFAVQFHLATDPVNPNPSDVLLGQTTHTLNASGTLETSYNVTLPANTVPGTYYVRVSADSGNTNAETNENNNVAVSGAMSVLAQTIDISMAEATVAATRTVGHPLPIWYTIQNGGTGPTSAFTVKFYLTTDPVNPNPSDVLLAQTNHTMSASETLDTVYNATLPVNTIPGTYYVRVIADTENTNNETNENNNTFVTGAMTALAQTIDISMAEATVASTRTAGQSLSIYYTLQNGGTGPSSAFTVKFYLTTDPVNPQPSDVLLGQATHTMNASETLETVYNTTVPTNTAPGTYYVRVIADTENTNAETNENNNAAVSGAMTVTSGIDFILSEFSTPSSIATGVSTQVSSTIMNQGTGYTSVTSFIKFYLSSDTVHDGSDVLLSGSRQISSLAAGASNSGNTNITVPVNTAAGTYYVIGKADADNTNPESDESNNTAVSGPVMVTQ
jgi:YD repeat-containing protein